MDEAERLATASHLLEGLLGGPGETETPEAGSEALEAGLAQERKVDRVPSWRPFPVEALPEALRALAIQGGRSIGCDVSYIALPALVVCAIAIGLSRCLRIKRKWTEPAVLWGVIVGESGTAKSPALDLAAEPLREIESAARREYERAMREFKERDLEYKRELARWARAKDDSAQPEEPTQPSCARLIVQDSTIEALARVLAASPRGSVGVVRDELSAWFRSWGEYRSGASSESAKWLELHGARALSVDRVSASPIYVPRAAVSVIGGTQPGILQRVLVPEHLESGCAARIMFAWPPRFKRGWRDDDVDEAMTARYAEVVHSLHQLQPESFSHPDGDVEFRPEMLSLSPEARELFIAYVNQVGEEMVQLTGAEAAALSKLEGGAARFALVIELVRAAARGCAAQVTEVGAEAMAAGITIARWFAGESRRISSLLDETAEQGELREIDELIERRGGTLTPGELRRARRRYRVAGAAQDVLDRFVQAGLGGWEYARVGPRGGRPSRHVARRDGSERGTATVQNDLGVAGIGTGTADANPSDVSEGGQDAGSGRTAVGRGASSAVGIGTSTAGTDQLADGSPPVVRAVTEQASTARTGTDTPGADPLGDGTGTGTAGPGSMRSTRITEEEPNGTAGTGTETPDAGPPEPGIGTGPDLAGVEPGDPFTAEVLCTFDGELIPEGSSLGHVQGDVTPSAPSPPPSRRREPEVREGRRASGQPTLFEQREVHDA